MKERKAFCEGCRNDVAFTVVEKQLDACIKGEKYTYIGKEAYCTDCNMELFVDEINDYNLKALYDVYRNKNDIVSLETILEITKKYAIGKRPLSHLLGWGEQTFSRYCDGDLPTKQYSDVLKKIYDDPSYYAKILEKNKGNLKTMAAYEKSKRAVEDILKETVFTETKIDIVIEYLLNQCEDITPLALQKALYYIQGFYYAFYEDYLFFEDCEAWAHGPVYSGIYFRYREYKFDSIKGISEYDDSNISSLEKAILDSVVKNICCYSGKILECFTHSETPWLSTRKELPKNAASNRMIHKALIGEYFKAVKEKYNMISPKDIKSYAQAMFEQI